MHIACGVGDLGAGVCGHGWDMGLLSAAVGGGVHLFIILCLWLALSTRSPMS